MSSQPDHLACVACRQRARLVGLVCAPCSEAIATSPSLLPQQIIGDRVKRGEAALVDQWGRAHAIPPDCLVGRTAVATGISISDSSVSRLHARIEHTGTGWVLHDLDSSNGSAVNQIDVSTCVLGDGDRLAFGRVELYIVFDVGDLGDAAEPAGATAIGRASSVEAELTTDRLRLVEPTGGGGGFIELAAASAQLSPTQLELVDVLSRRMRDDAHLPWSVRGFVRSSELVGALSWDTTAPDETHVKQLVRRVRRTLLRSGVGDLIEARHRLGYRLRVGPNDERGGHGGHRADSARGR